LRTRFATLCFRDRHHHHSIAATQYSDVTKPDLCVYGINEAEIDYNLATVGELKFGTFLDAHLTQVLSYAQGLFARHRFRTHAYMWIATHQVIRFLVFYPSAQRTVAHVEYTPEYPLTGEDPIGVKLLYGLLSLSRLQFGLPPSSALVVSGKDYHLTAQLGRGSFATVYEADNAALKLFRAAPKGQEGKASEEVMDFVFQHERRVLTKLQGLPTIPSACVPKMVASDEHLRVIVIRPVARTWWSVLNAIAPQYTVNRAFFALCSLR
jgi:hypothetical protein